MAGRSHKDPTTPSVPDPEPPAAAPTPDVHSPPSGMPSTAPPGPTAAPSTPVQAADVWVSGAVATLYGPTDALHSDWNDGTCKCTNFGYSSGTPCLVSIGPPSHIAAVDISGGMVGNGQNVGTNTCGTCLYVRCVAGPTRGLPNSKYPGPAPCLPGNPEVFVQITDSCPCTQNPSNFANCCNSRQSVTSAENATTVSRHLDLSQPAFAAIADPGCGNMDVEYKEVPCGPNNGDDGAVWTSWEQHFNTTMATWSQNILAAYQDSGGVLLNVRSNTPIDLWQLPRQQ